MAGRHRSTCRLAEWQLYLSLNLTKFSTLSSIEASGVLTVTKQRYKYLRYTLAHKSKNISRSNFFKLQIPLVF